MLGEADANQILEAIGAEYGWAKETSAFPIVVEDRDHNGYDGNGLKRKATGYELRDGNWWEPADLSSRAAFEAQARKYFESFPALGADGDE